MDLEKPLSEQDNTAGIFSPEDAVACYDRAQALQVDADRRSLPLGEKVLGQAGERHSSLRVEQVEDLLHMRPLQRQDDDLARIEEWLTARLGQLEVCQGIREKP
jgi:hypothetical protein